jgi:hypothetical protein
VRSKSGLHASPKKARPDHEKYILVLDLDETLVHYKESIKFNISDYDKLKVRPGV